MKKTGLFWASGVALAGRCCAKVLAFAAGITSRLRGGRRRPGTRPGGGASSSTRGPGGRSGDPEAGDLELDQGQGLELDQGGRVDVLDLPRLRAVKRIHRNGMTGERFKRQRRNKTACALRHHNKNVDAPLLQQAQQLACLINRNAPGHAEDNARFFHLT